jgi:hypothetical protein
VGSDCLVICTGPKEKPANAAGQVLQERAPPSPPGDSMLPNGVLGTGSAAPEFRGATKKARQRASGLRFQEEALYPSRQAADRLPNAVPTTEPGEPHCDDPVRSSGMHAFLVFAISALALLVQPQSASATSGAADLSSQRQIVCPHVYSPVCAVTRGGWLRTYPNSCHAQAAGARILSRGECRARRRPHALCPQVYQPVCAVTRRGSLRTYSNSCFAVQDGARVLHRGRCRVR